MSISATEIDSTLQAPVEPAVEDVEASPEGFENSGRWSIFVKKAVYMAAFVHLLIAAGTIFHAFDQWLGFKSPLEKPISFYSSLNFAVWRYGFFAPDVGRSTEIEIKVYRPDGQVTRYSTLDGFAFFTANIESSNRFYSFKRLTVLDDTLRDLTARSVATRMLNIFQDASRIDYTVRSVGYPSMQDYLKGVPVRKALFYTTTFELKPNITEEREPSGLAANALRHE